LFSDNLPAGVEPTTENFLQFQEMENFHGNFASVWWNRTWKNLSELESLEK